MPAKTLEKPVPPDIGGRRVITVVNQKGGSTKTTTTVGLAYSFVQRGFRVRMWDVDPQAGSITHWIPPQSQVGEGLLEVYRGTHKADEVTSLTTVDNLFIIPSWKAMREVENRRRPGDEMILRTAVLDSTGPIDIEVIDSTHSMNALSVGAVAAATRDVEGKPRPTQIVIPLQPSELDLQGMTELLEMIDVVKTHYSPGVQIAAIVIGQANPRSIYDQNILSDFKTAYPMSYVGYIPTSTKMHEAVAAQIPHQMHVKSPKNAVNVQFAALAESFVDGWTAP